MRYNIIIWLIRSHGVATLTLLIFYILVFLELINAHHACFEVYAGLWRISDAFQTTENLENFIITHIIYIGILKTSYTWVITEYEDTFIILD